MAHQLEQEFKTGVTTTQAAQLQAAYPFQPPFTQTNHYFDTPDQALKNAHMGLRIRQFVDHSEQTLKVPKGPQRLLEEYTDPLPLGTTSLVAGGAVAEQLKVQGIAWQALRPFAQATTTRWLSPQAAGLLTLDHTVYPNGHSDWELELEYQQAHVAEAFWATVLQRFAITPTKVTNKVARAALNVKSSQTK